MAGFNLQSCRQLRHFSHPHILELNTWNGGPAGEQLYCEGCIKPIRNGLVYRCRVCDFNLHLSYAQIPQQISHPADSHLLNLLSRPRANAGGVCACDECGQHMRHGFDFHCSLCNLDLHPSCANLPMKFNYQHHPEHTLKLHFVPPYEDKSFTCCVCGERSKSLWHYHCSECLYDVHATCTHSLREDPTNQFFEVYTEEVKRFPESLQELNQNLNAYTQGLRARQMPIRKSRYPDIYSVLTRPSMFNSSPPFHVRQQQRPPFPSAYGNVNYNMFRRPGMELIMQNLSGGTSNNVDFMSMTNPGVGGGGDSMISPGGGGDDLDIFGNLSGIGGFSGIMGSMFGFGFF